MRTPDWADWLHVRMHCPMAKGVGMRARTLADDERFRHLLAARITNAAHKSRDRSPIERLKTL